MEPAAADRGSKRPRSGSLTGEDGSAQPKAGVAGLQSCDACRAQKVKCNAPLPPDSTPTTEEGCARCRKHSFPCTYTYKPRKRGPPALTYDRLITKMSTQTSRPRPKPRSREGVSHYQQPDSYHPTGTIISPQVSQSSPHHAISSPADDLPQFGDPGPSTTAARDQQSSHLNAFMQPVEGIADADLAFSFDAATPRLPYANPEGVRAAYPPVMQSPLDPSPFSVVSGEPEANSIDSVLPRALLHHVVDLFFDYVYGLVPCLHRTTFMRDMYARREELPDQEEWTTLVLMVVAATLCHLPRHLIPIPRAEVRRIVERCFARRGSYMATYHTVITTNYLIILYLTNLVAHSIGLDVVGVAAYGSSYRLAVQFRLNTEDGYAGLDPVETEMRRRVFWLLYGSDKTDSIVSGRPLCWHEDDCSDVQLPMQVDDEYVTVDGYMSTAGARTPVLSGFYYISKLFRLTGQIIEMKRMDYRRVPCGIGLQMRLNEVDELINRVMSLMHVCPPELRLQVESENSMEHSFVEWNAAASDIEALFFNVTRHRTSPKQAFLVQQANIYITQQMTRYYALQYRDDLLALRAKETETNLGLHPVVDSWRAPFTSRVAKEARLQAENEKDSVASDTLAVLLAIPLEVIAVNGTSLVAKVRFVASTLLDSFMSGAVNSNEASELPESTKRAHDILGKFLSILSEIEALYSWDDGPQS